MRTTRLFAAALIGFAATSVAAQETARVSVASESRLWIEGTSNVHAWSCSATQLDATVEVDKAAAALLDSAPPKALKGVEVKVPVKSLKCGHDGMDNNLYKALNANATPEVSYILATFDAVPGDSKDAFTLKTVGTLTVSGKTNSISMDVVATRMPDGTIKATGMVPIKMTDYGIKPPTAIFGTLRSGDGVKINFELTISAKALAAALDDK